MEGVGLRVKNEGKCVSVHLILRGGFLNVFHISKIRLSSIFEQIMVVFHF